MLGSSRRSGGEGGGGDGGQWQPLIEGACADTQNPSRPRGGVEGRKTKEGWRWAAVRPQDQFGPLGPDRGVDRRLTCLAVRELVMRLDKPSRLCDNSCGSARELVMRLDRQQSLQQLLQFVMLCCVSSHPSGG